MAVKQELDANLQVRVPKAFLADIDAAAERLMVNRADFIRLTLLNRVRADRIDLAGGTVAA